MNSSAFERVISHCPGNILHSGFGSFSFSFAPPRQSDNSPGTPVEEFSTTQTTGTPTTPRMTSATSPANVPRPSKKHKKSFLELPFVEVGGTEILATKKLYEANLRDGTPRPWYWCRGNQARSPLRFLRAMVRSEEIEETVAGRAQVECTHEDCALVGRFIPCHCSKGRRQRLCGVHCAEHYATFVRQGVSECGCFATDIRIPEGLYTLVTDIDERCKEIDDSRALADMKRVVAHFCECVADRDREKTPGSLRSPHALDLANVLASRVFDRIEPANIKRKRRMVRDKLNAPKSRKRLFVNTAEELPDITVQKIEWPPQPPPLVIN